MSALLVQRHVRSEQQRFRGWKSLRTAVAVVSLFAVGAFAEEPGKLGNLKVAQRAKVTSDEDWKIQIVPGPAIGRSPLQRANVATRTPQDSKEPAPAPEPEAEVITADATASTTSHINPAAYAEVYNSIPFSRTEYMANTDYRHEATLEILFGQLRPKTVVRSGASQGSSRTSFSIQSLGRTGGLAPSAYWWPAYAAGMGMGTGYW